MKKTFLFILCMLLLIPQAAYANVNETGVPVLMYHHFTDDGNVNSPTVDKKDFERQMFYLYENGYTTIHLRQLGDFIDGKIKLPAKTVVITMDDGYRSNYEIAYPILKKYSMKATQFPIVSNISSSSEFTTGSPRLPHCSEAEMKEMRDVFDFQSHTWNIHSLTEKKQSLLLETPSADVEKDFTKANTTLFMMGYSPIAFSYPYGAYNDSIKNHLKSKGIHLAVTVRPGRVKAGSNKLEIPRYNISGKMSFEDFKKIVSENPNNLPESEMTQDFIKDEVSSAVFIISPEQHGEFDSGEVKTSK